MTDGTVRGAYERLLPLALGGMTGPATTAVMGAQWKQKWRELNADRKGKLVNKLVKEIQVAARLGGPNPEFNARLGAAVDAARKASVYRETIERAIAKGSGTEGGGDSFESVVFEGFTPHRVPIIVECLTDNNNRTGPELRVLFRAGSLGNVGSVAWMFDRVGLIEAWTQAAGADAETAAIEAGADDLSVLEASEIDDLPERALAVRFYCATTALDAVSKALRQGCWTITASELSYRPKDFPVLSASQREEISAFLQTLDEHSDVHRIHIAMQ